MVELHPIATEVLKTKTKIFARKNIYLMICSFPYWLGFYLLREAHEPPSHKLHNSAAQQFSMFVYRQDREWNAPN
jgi:hypothetical protein